MSIQENNSASTVPQILSFEDFWKQSGWHTPGEEGCSEYHLAQDAWNAAITARSFEQLNQKQSWIEGQPPQEAEVAWLLLDVDEGLRAVKLGVFDDDGTWSEAGDWKGESYNNVIDSPIIGWMPFELPTPPRRGKGV